MRGSGERKGRAPIAGDGDGGGGGDETGGEETRPRELARCHAGLAEGKRPLDQTPIGPSCNRMAIRFRDPLGPPIRPCLVPKKFQNSRHIKFCGTCIEY